MAKKKTIKYLENGEYHDATVKDVGVIEELKTESKDNLVEAINEIFLGGGKGFSDLQQKVNESAEAAQNAQQATNNLQQKLDEVAQNVGLSDEEARKIINQAVEDAKRAQAEALQAYKEAQKELDDSIAQFMEEQKAINQELEQAKDSIQEDIEQKNAEVEQINEVIESTKSDLTATSARLASVRNDLSNAQMDWGKVRQEITNINGKLASKMSNTDFDEYKERIERNETEITQTKNELQSKATKQDLDVLTGTVTTQGSSITQLAGKIEQKVSKDTLANDIDDFQVKKANIFTGTREFMGWEFSDKALGRVNDDIYNHAKVAELHNGSNLSITVNGLEVGKTYSVSIFAKTSANSNTSGVKVTVDNGKSYSGLMRTVYTPHDTKVTTNWQRYYATIVASATTMKFVFDRSGITSDITLYLNRPKLEVGETVYAWEDNAQDIYKRVEHTEAQFDVYNDQISGIVKRQTETDKKIENVSSTFTQRADGIEANSKKYTNDKVTGLTEEFSGKLRATSTQLSTEYEKQTNAKIGALSDGGSNLILNSSFLVTDDNGNATLENWRDTSSKVRLTNPNGLDGTWIKVNRATTGTALGARSNYFPVKQGKLVVGVDVALDGTGNISPYVLRIEYYDASNNRVNYEDITLQKLGLSASQITKSGSNFRYARGVYKTSNDRSDVAKACIVVPETITGYDMYLTNFFAKFSDVNDGTYEVNPLDQQASLIKQRTKIEQDSEKINLLNTQTEKLGNDIKATNTSIGVLKGEINLKASQSTVNDLTNRVSKNEADIKVFPDKIKSEVRGVSKKIDGVSDKVDNMQVGGTNLLKDSLVPLTASDIWTNNGVSNQIVDDYVRIRGNGDNNRIYQPFSNNELNADGYYSISFWASNDGNGEEFDVQVGAWNSLQTVHITGSTLKLYKLENVWLGGNPTFSFVAPFGKVVRLKKIKLEKGNKATDWSPAPEDADSKIEEVKSVATQTKDGFERLTQKTGYNASTGEFAKVTTQINEGIKGISSEVKSVSNRLDNLSVGGTNLLKDSLVPLTASDVWIADGVSSQVLNDYVRIRGMGDNNRIYQPFSNNGLNADGYYSISFWAGNDNNNEEFDIQVGAWNSLQTVHITTGMIKRYKLENVWLGGNPSFSFVAPFNTVVRLKKIKLEKGAIATDWTPSPEDLQEGINIATTKATQTDTKFERMLNQIQYNDSTGEIGKYEHKITELSNGTQEKISAIQLDNDKKLQSATQTLTNKIGDLESTVRTNTTNIGQYRQEMTNSAKELSTKFTSVQNDISSVSNRLDNLSVGGTNLAKHTSNTLTNRMQVSEWVYVASSGNTANFNLDNYKGQTLTMRAWIDKPTVDAHLQVWTNSSNNGYDVGNTIKAGQSGYSSLTFKVPTSFTEWNISIGNGKVAELAYKEFKVEKGTIATDWTPSPEDLQEGINIATTKATQTDTKFERMLNQIQYNDSTGEIGKYEHKITELSNGTQEKISAITKRGSNMIIKSNFDDGTDVGGWYNASGAGYSSELYRTTTTPKPDEMSSNYCIALGGRDVLEDGNIFPVVAGTKYHISAWAYTSQKYQGKVGLFLGNSTNSSARNWIGVTVPKDSQNRWIKIKGTVTIPNGYNKAQPWLQVEKNGSNNEKIYFADMNISRVDDNAIEMNETITTKIGDLEKTIRTNTTNIGQYRQEMTNSAKEWSTKFTSYQNLMQNDISSAAETARTNAKNDAISAIKGDSQWQSMGKIVTNASFLQNADGFAQEVARTATPMIKGGGVNLLKDSLVPLTASDIWINNSVSNQIVDDYVRIRGIGDNNRIYQSFSNNGLNADGYYSISFWASNDGNNEEFDVQVGTWSSLQTVRITGSTLQLYKLENVWLGGNPSFSFVAPFGKVVRLKKIKLEKGAIATDWTPSPEDLATKLQLNDISSRTQFLQDDKQFLLRVQQVGGATQADVNSANSKIGDLSTRVKNTEVAITSGGVTINGNTKINGELQAQNMVLKGKSSTMALNGDSGVAISDNTGKFGMRLTGAKLNFDLMFNNDLEKLGGIIATKNSASNNVNGMHLYVTPLQTLGKPYGGDEIGIGKQTALSGSGNIQSAMIYNATGVSKGEGFHWYKPSYLETTEGRTIRVSNAHDPLIWRALKWGASTQGDYYQPFLSLGYNDDTVGDSGIGFYWNSVKLAGSVDMSDARIWMKDAEANIRFGWTSWSDWTGKIPSMYRTEWGKTQSTGGIGFGGDGNVILFGGNRRWDMNHH